MLDFLKRPYHHLNTIFINQQALIDNHLSLRKVQPGTEIAPVLKSSAYGHGLQLVAPVFDKLKPPFLVVDSLYEAYELYKINIKTPILILGYTDPKNYQIKKLPFHYVVFDLETAKVLNKHQPDCEVHIFVDTGMSREGVQLADLKQFVRQLQKLSNLKITGLCSHLADADNPTSQTLTRKQLKNFHQAYQIMQNLGMKPKWRHLAASGGAFKIKDPVLNLVRAGLVSYGLNPFEKKDSIYKKVKLQPALSFHSTLTTIKQINKGDIVSYNATFKAPKTMTIGVIPSGYYEGVDRRLSNQGVVKIKDQYCPIIGRVCMNLTVVDLSKVKNPQVGDQVQIYSDQPQDKNSIAQSAQMAKTISYELLVKLNETIKRRLN